MSYYRGCKLTIEVPKEYDQAAIKEALVEDLPGIEVRVQIPTLRTVEAFVPDNHGMTGMSEQVGGGPVVRTGGRTLLQRSDEILGRFKPKK